MNGAFCLMAALGLTTGAVIWLGGVGSGHHESPRPEPVTTVVAPEIDPTTITGPLILLGAGTLILTDHRRRVRAQV